MSVKNHRIFFPFVKLLRAFLNNGVTDPTDSFQKRTAHLANIYAAIIMVYMTLLGFQVWLAGEIWLAVFDFTIAFLLLSNFFLLQRTKNIRFSAHLILVLLAATLLFLSITGGNEGTGPFGPWSSLLLPCN